MPSSLSPRVLSVAVPLALALIAAMLAVPVPPARADHREHTRSLGGEDAVEAAIAWSQVAFPETAPTVLLARDDAFPDALASGLVQGISDAPLLLTPPDALDERVRRELDRLQPQQAALLGGSDALSEDVEAELVERGMTVQRYAGASRVETAVALARAFAPEAVTALVARAYQGRREHESAAWADALAGGAWAADGRRPLLLTTTGELHQATRAYLDASSISAVLVLGGSAAVSDAVVAELEALGLSVRRVAGANRAETAVAIADARGFADAAVADRVLLLDGGAPQAWAAGLTAAAYAARVAAPIVLANERGLPPETEAFLSPAAQDPPPLDCAPFTGRLACDAAAAALGRDTLHENATASEAPELRYTQVRSVGEQGLVVAFAFDEDVTVGSAGAAAFRVAAPDTTAVAEASAVDVDEAEPHVVLATFPPSDASAQATVGLVEADAVTDDGDVGNPPGGAELDEAVRPAGAPPPPPARAPWCSRWTRRCAPPWARRSPPSWTTAASWRAATRR